MTSSDMPKIGDPAARALQSAGIQKLKDFTRFTKADVAQLHGVGPKAIGIIQKELQRKKLSFKKIKL